MDEDKLTFYHLLSIPGLQELPREEDSHSPAIDIPGTLVYGNEIMDTIYVS